MNSPVWQQNCLHFCSHQGGNFARPKVLNKRRNDRVHQTDAWSQRCVDVFDIIAQIGEGTYGHVYKARPQGCGE